MASTDIPISDENLDRFWNQIGFPKPEGERDKKHHWIWTGGVFRRKRTTSPDTIQPYFYARTDKGQLTKVYAIRFAWKAFVRDLISNQDWIIRMPQVCEEAYCVNPWHFTKALKTTWYEKKHGYIAPTSGNPHRKEVVLTEEQFLASERGKKKVH